MDSMTIRAATHDDIDVLARILVSGFHATYDGLVDPEWLAAKTEDEYRGKWREWLDSDGFGALVSCLPDGTPVGVVSFGKLKTPPPGVSLIRPLYTAEIYAIYILPEHWRQGHGLKLMQAATESLLAMKHKSMCLWALEANKRAGAFYTTLGAQRIGKRDIEAGSRKAREVCFAWRDTRPILATKKADSA
ncbi:N-acetyltransferase family protein [Micavibrio aeruginosavorus]|uniref:GNAT family N-acetyltransferase n=1 Tax=Micavibrio aeruginosavorus TaxID=349221 RepID=UPI003F4AD663